MYCASLDLRNSKPIPKHTRSKSDSPLPDKRLAGGLARRTSQRSAGASPVNRELPETSWASGDICMRQRRSKSSRSRHGSKVQDPAPEMSPARTDPDPKIHASPVSSAKMIIPRLKVTIPQSEPEFHSVVLDRERLTTAVHDPYTPPETMDRLSPREQQEPLRISVSPEPSASTLNWQYIQRLRDECWTLRSKIHEIRGILRIKQNAKSTADDALFRRMVLRYNHLSLKDLGIPIEKETKTLEELMQDCQIARDAYGPVEDECNELEDSLNSQELKLSRLEARFQDLPQERQDPPNLGYFVSEPPSPASGDEFEDSQYHPLVSEYLSKMGDLDILRERLDELLEERETLIHQKALRYRVDRLLDPEDQEWLDQSEDEQEKLLLDIRRTEHELEELRQDCLSKSLIDQDGEPTSFRIQEQSSFHDEGVSLQSPFHAEEETNPFIYESEYLKYPGLLPQPGRKHDEIRRPEPIHDESDIARNINHWLLQILRISPLEVNLLASTYQAVAGPTPEQWESNVLSMWYNDSTMRTFKNSQLYTSTLSAESHYPEAQQLLRPDSHVDEIGESRKSYRETQFQRRAPYSDSAQIAPTTRNPILSIPLSSS